MATERAGRTIQTIYRLRRRLEQATEELVPLQSQPRVGYVFRGTLIGV